MEAFELKSELLCFDTDTVSKRLNFFEIESLVIASMRTCEPGNVGIIPPNVISVQTARLITRNFNWLHLIFEVVL